MTTLRSWVLTRAGFGHGFGTRKTAHHDYPPDTHILLQVHGERIVALSGGPRAQGERTGRRAKGAGRRENPDVVRQGLPEEPFRFDEGDAMVTDIPGTVVGIRTADCLPVLVGDKASGAVAAIHCGWRSLALGLAGKGVRALLDLTGSDSCSLVAALGPSIGPCCYEVGEEVREAFDRDREDAGLFESRGRSVYLDLAAGARTQLLAEGIAPEAIEKMPGCTSCNEDRFWSWRARRDEDRMISFIRAKKPSS